MSRPALHGPLFDAAAFGNRVAQAVAAVGGGRKAAPLAGVSTATLSRACNGWPNLSHEAVLRLEAWMATEQAA